MMLAHNTYANMFEEDLMFCMEEKYSQDYLDNMLPFERELFIHKYKEIQKQKKEDADKQKQNMSVQMPKAPRMR